MQGLRHGVAHAVLPHQTDALAAAGTLQHTPGGAASRCRRLLRDEVHQIVDVQHVATGEHAGQGGSQRLVHHRPAGDGVQCRAGLPGQLVLRQQSHAQQQRVAGDVPLRAGDGQALPVHLRQRHTGEMLLPVDLHHRGGQVQGDMEIVQTLDDVALQTTGVGHDLRHGLDLGALQRHTPGHDEPDVAGAEDHHLPSRQIALHVHHALGRARRPDTGGAGARDVQRAPGPLAAAHGQHHRLRPDLPQAHGASRDGQHLLRRDVQHHAVRPRRDAPLPHGVDIALGVLRAGQLLMEGVEAEARVDALVQDAAQLAAAL